MVSTRYANAMKEVLEYLKGISQEDIDKIPKKLIRYFEENASKDYECKFDYNKPLKELNLLDETRGLIAMICLNYWCITPEQKNEFISNLNENERKYQERLRKKCNPDNIFTNVDYSKKVSENIEEKSLLDKKENFILKLLNRIKNIFKRKAK